jgi:hypothetical protein
MHYMGVGHLRWVIILALLAVGEAGDATPFIKGPSLSNTRGKE